MYLSICATLYAVNVTWSIVRKAASFVEADQVVDWMFNQPGMGVNGISSSPISIDTALNQLLLSTLVFFGGREFVLSAAQVGLFNVAETRTFVTIANGSYIATLKVPEPSAAPLFAAGLVAMAWLARRHRARPKARGI